jgi:thioredoxin-related protein
MKIEKRAVIVFIHTSWCKFCQQFQETTLKNKKIQKILNDDFYFVDIDADAQHDIVFRGHIFKYDPVYRLHDLAKELGTKDGKVSYPTIAFLNEDLEILYQHDGYLSASELVPVLEKVR